LILVNINKIFISNIGEKVTNSIIFAFAKNTHFYAKIMQIIQIEMRFNFDISGVFYRRIKNLNPHSASNQLFKNLFQL